MKIAIACGKGGTGALVRGEIEARKQALINKIKDALARNIAERIEKERLEAERIEQERLETERIQAETKIKERKKAEYKVRMESELRKKIIKESIGLRKKKKIIIR